MGNIISYSRPDKKNAQAYVSLTGKQAPNVVVLHEWWGLQGQIENVVEKIKDAGYNTIAPNLYSSKPIAYHHDEEASKEMKSLNFAEAATQTVRGAALYLQQYAPLKVGVIGFCMGGALSVLSAVKNNEFNACVSCYGLPPETVVRGSDVKISFQGHFANKDNFATPMLVEQFEKSISANKVTHEFYRYEAQHAFMNDERPEVYNKQAAELAWTRIWQFFAVNLTG